MKQIQLRTSLALLLLFLVQIAASLSADPASILSQADSASQVKNTFKTLNFRIVQFYRQATGHYSYLVISAGRVLCVDPGRDTRAYLEYSGREGLEWVGTLLTHTHSDFIAGHREMASKTGAPIYVSRHSNALYPHIELKEGDEIAFGNAIVKIIETPGHTRDSICALISTASAPHKTEYLLSGDTLLAGQNGVPELIGENVPATSLAGMMFETWHNKLSQLDDSVVVLPAHGDISSTTIGKEKANNIYLPFLENKDDFIIKLVSDIKPVADYLKENARINRIGPELITHENISSDEMPQESVSSEPAKLTGQLPSLSFSAEPVSVEELTQMLKGNAPVRTIDIRSAEDFLDYQISGSENLSFEEIGKIDFAKEKIVILIDCDGSRAAPIAGTLRQKTGADIRFLRGGIRLYWNKTEMPEEKMPRRPAQLNLDENHDKMPAKPPVKNIEKGAGC